MAVTEHSSGTQACTIGTDHTLATVASGTSVLYVDLENMATGDAFEIWAMTQVKAGGTMRRAYPVEQFFGDYTGDHFVTIPIANSHSVEWHLRQTGGGAGRSLDWSVQLL